VLWYAGILITDILTEKSEFLLYQVKKVYLENIRS
jgi:hypothetical protein